MQYANNILKYVSALFGQNSSGEEAWVDNDKALTPREQLVRRVSNIMQWGSLLNVVILILLNLALMFGWLESGTMANWLLPGWTGTSAEMTLLGLIAIGANVAVLLLISTLAGAQEFWTWLLLIAMIGLNIAGLVMFRFYPAILGLLPAHIGAFFMFKDPRAFHLNSVGVRELRGRMRGVRSFAIITVFLLLMGSFVVLLYLLQLPRLRTTDIIITGNLGQLLFFGVVGVELMLIVFIVPALTSGSITGERERKTYDLLQTTLLSAPTFIVGKMESALGYIVLLLLSAIPLQSIAFLFGGVSQTEIYVTFILLMATALLLGALGMFFSAMVDKTMSSTVRVYTVAVGLVFGLPLVSLMFFQGAFISAVNQIAVHPNPARELFFIYGDMLWSSLNPMTSAYYTQQMIITHQEIFLLEVELQNNTIIPVIAPWIITTIVYSGATAMLLLMAVRRMRRSS